MGSGTYERGVKLPTTVISIHPLRGEWDLVHRVHTRPLQNFNPPTPWGVGRPRQAVFPRISAISIHPLRGEWDGRRETYARRGDHFNPPTPWGVGRRVTERKMKKTKDFNPPTPWGVGRGAHGKFSGVLRFQSTHSVGSGINKMKFRDLRADISIHPLRGEWDCR